jgi:hypothetical protein
MSGDSNKANAILISITDNGLTNLQSTNGHALNVNALFSQWLRQTLEVSLRLNFVLLNLPQE